MITEEKQYRAGQLVIFRDEISCQRRAYEIKAILKGPLIVIGNAVEDIYTPQEFQKRNPVIVGEVRRAFGIFTRRIFYPNQ